MGIFVGKYDHINTEKICKNRSKAWVGRFNPCNSNDMQEYEMVKAIVRNVNSNIKEKFRVERKGRKPIQGFVYGGNPKGGMKNATLWDVYIWKRHDLSNIGKQRKRIPYPDPTWCEYS